MSKRKTPNGVSSRNCCGRCGRSELRYLQWYGVMCRPIPVQSLVSDGRSTTTYAYDSFDQLVRENNQAAGKTWTYAYDDGGNILSKTEYAYTTGTLGTAQNRTYLKNFKSYPLKMLLSEEEGRETETLCLLSVYAASGQVNLDNPIPIHQVHSHRRCDEQKLP